jgi:hypothetical protein
LNAIHTVSVLNGRISNLGCHFRMARLPVELNPSNAVSIGSALLFLLTPFLTSPALRSFVDSMIGRIVLIAFVLYGITLGPIAGVLSFLAAVALFVERNRVRIGIAKNAIVTRGSVQTLGQVDMPHSSPAPVQGPIEDVPWIQYSQRDFLLEGNSWNPLPSGESEDTKMVLESQLYPNDRIDRYYVKHGLAPPTDPNRR